MLEIIDEQEEEVEEFLDTEKEELQKAVTKWKRKSLELEMDLNSEKKLREKNAQGKTYSRGRIPEMCTCSGTFATKSEHTRRRSQRVKSKVSTRG